MSLAGCAAIVERGDPDRFLAAMAAPVGVRARLWPIYAFNVEVARAPWVTGEPMIAEMRLQWWRDVLAELAAGRVPRGHEVIEPLTGLIGEASLPIDLFDAIVEARRWDIGSAPFGGELVFEHYLERTAGNPMWLAALALGAEPEAEAAVRSLAWASGLAAFLRAVPELEARGRRALVDPRPEAVAALAREGLARLHFARSHRRKVARALAPALLAGWRAEPTLTRAARAPGLVGAGRLCESEARRRGRLLWRSLRGTW